MESFVIKGGQPLSGSIRPAGNKNAALPIVAASLLADEPVLLRNVPGSWTWRRCWSWSPRPGRRWSGPAQRGPHRPARPAPGLARPGAVHPHPGLGAAGGAAGGPDRPLPAAARRRRDRPPARHPPAGFRPWASTPTGSSWRWRPAPGADVPGRSRRRPPRTPSWPPSWPRARRSSATPPASPRPGPLPLPGRPGRPHLDRLNLLTIEGVDRSPATHIGSDYIEVASFVARPWSPGASWWSRAWSRTTCAGRGRLPAWG